MRRFLLLTFFAFSFQALAQDSFNMQALGNWSTDEFPASGLYSNTYNEVWGFAQEGREYGIIGTTGGTHFIDVTNPHEPVEIDFVEGNSTGPNIVHRDYHSIGKYLYMVCHEGPTTLQIADMSDLPDSVHVVYDSNEVLRGSHNIFIDTVQTRLYAVYTNQGTTTVTKVIDIQNPYTPVLLGILHDDEPVHDLYVNDGITYLNRGYLNGLEIWDYSELPGTFLGSLTEYEGQGYNHSGYPTPDGSLYIMADENRGSPMKLLDTSDPSDIEVLSTLTTGVHEYSIPHNQIIHNGLIYAAYYYDGLYMWSFEDPLNPELMGYFDTSIIPHSDEGFAGAWGVYPFLPSGNILVSDMQSGLWVLEYDETLGVQKKSPPSVLNMWPNPCDNLIKVGSEVTIGRPYSIRDLMGRVVESGKIDSNRSIDVGSLGVGSYLLTTTQGNRKVTSRFVKR